MEDPKSAWGIIARVARSLFGTHSWLFIPLPLSLLGYFGSDNAKKNRIDKGHLSNMEQEASEESGELYSPVGRLRGQLEYVGDVARYWYFIENRAGDIIQAERQDAPGVHLEAELRVLPQQAATASPSPFNVNLQLEAAADTAEPGNQVPDIFMRKPDADPTTASPLLNPRGFTATDRGFVPTSARVERNVGMYVAFTQPSTSGAKHRITVRNDIGGAVKGREAQEAGKQKLFFDKEIKDVEVRVAGLVVGRAAPGAPLLEIELAQTQRAKIQVTPNAARRYKTRLLRPTGGDLLRADGETIVTRARTGSEPVEVCRFYQHATGPQAGFVTGGLKEHGLHLPGDVFVPVRRFRIKVVDTLLFRSVVDLVTPPAPRANQARQDSFACQATSSAFTRRPSITWARRR